MPKVSRAKLIRLVAFALGLGGLYLGARATGLTDYLSIAELRTLLADAGGVGIALFLLAYAGSNLISIPALVFILAALVSYGGALGIGLAFGGGLLAASTSFFAVRVLKGNNTPAPAVETPVDDKPSKMACLMRPLERRPVRTVALLRMLLMLSGPLNMALAASKIRFRQYITGTAIGLMPPLCFYALTLDCWIPS